MRSVKLDFLFASLCICAFFVWGTNRAFAAGTVSPSAGNNNQDKINSALTGGGTVHLSAGTYWINDSIKLTSNSTLEGESGTVIKLIGNANWPQNKALLEGHSVSNVHITGFEIDGNGANNEISNGVNTNCGKYYYTMIYFTDSKSVEVDHMNLHDNWNDIFKFSGSSDMRFHDNVVRKEGHDVVYAINSHDVFAYGNDIKIACNSGIRPDGTKNISIYNNEISRDGGGYAGIEIQGASTVWICNDNIHDTKGPSIADLSNGAATINYTNCPTPGASATSSSGTGGTTGTTSTSAGTGGTTNTGGTNTANAGNTGGTTPYEYSVTSSLSFSAPVSVTPATSPTENQVNPIFPSPSQTPSSASTACRTDDSAKNTAGLVPCGRSANDPATPWNECDPCNLCGLVRMGQLNIEFLVKMAAIAATLSIVIGGLVYIVAAGREDTVRKAKSMIKYTLIGFVVIFIAWAIVDSVLTTLGYIDPIEGQWYTMC